MEFTGSCANPRKRKYTLRNGMKRSAKLRQIIRSRVKERIVSRLGNGIKGIPCTITPDEVRRIR